MGRQEVLAEPVLDYAERKVRIEADPLPKNIGDLIDQAAAEAGDKLLWNFFEAGETITYDQMRRKVNGLAAKLLDLGITKGTHVGVMLPNIPALPLTWLALGRIGAVMLPINNAYKARELEHVMTTAEGRWIVSHADCLPVVEEVVDAGAIDTCHHSLGVRVDLRQN